MTDISPWFVVVMSSIYLLGCCWEWGVFDKL